MFYSLSFTLDTLFCTHFFTTVSGHSTGTIGAIFLSIGTYLSTKGKSFCKSSACDIVGSYLNMQESLLLAAGAVLYWVLVLVMFLQKRYQHFPSLVLALCIIPALAFNGALIGYQFFTLKEHSVLYLGTA